MLLVEDNLLVHIVAVLLNNLSVLTTELVDLGLSKSAGRNAVLEEDIELSVGTSLWLWKTEIGPDGEEEAESGPEEARSWSPVPGVDTKLVWNEE